MTRKVGDVLTVLLDKKELAPPTKRAEVVLRWPEFVGEGVARHSQALKVSRGALTVSVDSSVWATELATHTPILLERIEAALGSGVVEEIRFVVRARRGVIRPGGEFTGGGDQSPRSPTHDDLLGVVLTPEQQAEIERVGRTVQDPDLASAVSRWMALTLKARRWRDKAGSRPSRSGRDGT